MKGKKKGISFVKESMRDGHCACAWKTAVINIDVISWDTHTHTYTQKYTKHHKAVFILKQRSTKGLFLP